MVDNTGSLEAVHWTSKPFNIEDGASVKIYGNIKLVQSK